VQEEETTVGHAEEVDKLEINEEGKTEDSVKSPKLKTSAIIEAQLYEELSELKPIVCKKFMSLANICLNTACAETVNDDSVNATAQAAATAATTTTSMVITPTYTTHFLELNPPLSESVKNNSIQINLCSSSKPQAQKPSVRFSDMPNVYVKSNRILTNGSMLAAAAASTASTVSKSSESEPMSSDLGSNSSSSTSISNESGHRGCNNNNNNNNSESIAWSSSEVTVATPVMNSSVTVARARSLIATTVAAATSGGLLVQSRRNSTVVSPSPHIMSANTSAGTLMSPASNNPRRVSLSVTDL
jgi:hypothetical protein